MMLMNSLIFQEIHTYTVLIIYIAYFINPQAFFLVKFLFLYEEKKRNNSKRGNITRDIFFYPQKNRAFMNMHFSISLYSLIYFNFTFLMIESPTKYRTLFSICVPNFNEGKKKNSSMNIISFLRKRRKEDVALKKPHCPSTTAYNTVRRPFVDWLSLIWTKWAILWKTTLV